MILDERAEALEAEWQRAEEIAEIMDGELTDVPLGALALSRYRRSTRQQTAREQASGSCVPPARASRKTPLKPCAGTGWPPSRGLRPCAVQPRTGLLQGSGRPAGRCRGGLTCSHPAALHGAALWGGCRGDRVGPAVRGLRFRGAGPRVSDADGLPVRGGAGNALGGARPGGRGWTIPAEGMKNRREHRVPLAARARQILAEA